MARNNKDKTPDPVIDEVLNETPPAIDEASDPKEITAIPEDEILPDSDNQEVVTEPEEETTEEIVEDQPTIPAKASETPEQKEQRYRAQQTEAQIQAERNKALIDKVEEANKVTDPTEIELKAFVRQDGVDWDELTTFEQSMAKKNYLSEKRFQLVSQAVETQKRVDEWAKSVDTFIDSTDGKPEYIQLSSNEADFRKFAMKEAHRGAPINILLSAFLHDLPAALPKRASLFERGGGGEKFEHKDGILDAEQAKALREKDPREYKRQLKAGKIKIEI